MTPTYTLDVRKESEWQMKCGGITYTPTEGNEPNRFHRFMQWLAFGFEWSKRPTPDVVP